MPANEKLRYVMTSDLRQYIAEYTVANFWRYPIRRRVTYASALEFLIIVGNAHSGTESVHLTHRNTLGTQKHTVGAQERTVGTQWTINPFMPGGIFYYNSLDRSISSRKVVSFYYYNVF